MRFAVYQQWTAELLRIAKHIAAAVCMSFVKVSMTKVHTNLFRQTVQITN